MFSALIIPDWPAPATVHAAATTRLGGVSAAPYDSFNLGTHCGDTPDQVAENRRLLVRYLNLPAEPAWLQQVHGACAVAAGTTTADAAYSFASNEVCVVLTADCLPVLFCDRTGSRVAAAHAGWRGLASGVLENTVAALAPAQLLVWLGPAIGPTAFEVGAEVRATFVEHSDKAAAAFRPTRPGHYLCDLYMLARQRLQAAGVSAIYGGEFCTYSDPARFYSYRRDGVTGRLASLIWRVG